MSKNLIEIIPGTYSLEDDATNESKAVYGTKKSDISVMQMSQPFANAPIEAPSTQEAVNILVGQNAKKDADNVRLNAENEQLAQRNKMLEKRQQKAGRECRIIDYNGGLYLKVNMYESLVYLANRVINSVTQVQLDTEDKMEIYYLIMSEGSPKGQVLIKEKDLYTDKLVNLMKNYLESPLNVEGYMKKTRLKDLMTQYIMSKVDRGQEGIVLHEHAGWHGKKWFSADFKSAKKKSSRK